MQHCGYDKNALLWRELYLAALFEPDRTQLQVRIAQAEEALVERARQLFQASGDSIEEAEAIDDAMYALHALRNTYFAGKSAVTSQFDAA